ncbi:hypothetical protein ABID99_003584 [Mucilaginibacter sp. OAE612]|uniref:hypothetical protein n=1 Tax=Mucilaginibacter sp. OAE612 TaxID=3156444 RepID=UPI00359E6CDB
MKKKYLFIAIPVIILVALYFKTKKSALQGSFHRTFVTQKIPALDTIKLGAAEVSDGIYADKNNLWINKRAYIVKYNKDGKQQIIIPAKYSVDKRPIINFYVQHDSLYYYQANTKTINFFNAKDSSQSSLNFSFPITYFVKLKNNSFIFLESVLGNASMQVHYIDYDHNRDTVDRSLFSKDAGSGMKYSGLWTISQQKDSYFFVPFYDDHILCFNSSGRIRYQFKPIDFQNQKLKIIKENNLFYLSPDANFIRPCAFSSKSRLFILSYVRSENQSQSDFKDNSTIDVYANEDGKYIHSFYLPRFSGENASDFAIADNKTLYACYGKNIVHYDLSKLLNNEN